MPRLTKKQRQENLKMILETLDERYGVNKAGFYHQESWQLLVAIMLSAQSTDKQVDEVLPALFQRFAHVEDMAEAPVPEIESYIKSVGIYKNKARNIKKCCQQIVTEYAGQVPNTLEEVLKLAGAGRKTGTLYLADAHGIPGITVDTHVFRISRRLGWAMGKNPQQVELELQKVLPVEHWNRINFQLIYLGREICTSRKAKCDQCPLTGFCPKLL